MVLAKVFGVAPLEVNDSTSNRSLPAWDSLGHMTLIVELESIYGVSLSPDDALRMTDVAAIKRILRDRGARW
jgi:acyl carrier protein